MGKIDVYLRSIERFSATGAVLASGQCVVLRFPAGDRQATQVTSHDALIAMVREVASPQALAAIDSNRPARFEIESSGMRYVLAVTPKQGAWQVVIDAVAPAAAAAASSAQAQGAPVDAGMAMASGDSLAIERGQYDEPFEGDTVAAAVATSRSALLDQLTQAARAARATDIYLGAGTPAMMRVSGELRPIADRSVLDGETLSRELGIVAPADARGGWSERGTATFAYGDGVGRVRATLTRDCRGPGAALRLLAAEPVAIERLGVPHEATSWLGQRGLIAVAGASGAGKTTTLAALVHSLAAVPRRVASFEVATEFVQASAAVSQRRIGEHVHSIASGIAGAMTEGVDAITVDLADNSEAIGAIIDAVAANHLVIVTMATLARDAEAHLIERVAADRRSLARAVVEQRFLGAIGVIASAAGRSFEVVPGRVR